MHKSRRELEVPCTFAVLPRSVDMFLANACRVFNEMPSLAAGQSEYSSALPPKAGLLAPPPRPRAPSLPPQPPPPPPRPRRPLLAMPREWGGPGRRDSTPSEEAAGPREGKGGEKSARGTGRRDQTRRPPQIQRRQRKPQLPTRAALAALATARGAAPPARLRCSEALPHKGCRPMPVSHPADVGL